MNITINTNAEATNSVIEGLANNTAAELPDIFVGDRLIINIQFSDGEGTLAEFSGKANHKILLAIGTLSDRNAMTTTATMSYETGAYLATLDLNTTELLDFVGTQPSIDLFLEIQISYAGDIAAPGGTYISNFADGVGFSTDDIGRNILALQDKAGRGLSIGENYQITSIVNEEEALHTGTTGAGIRKAAHLTQYEFTEAYINTQPNNTANTQTLCQQNVVMRNQIIK